MVGLLFFGSGHNESRRRHHGARAGNVVIKVWWDAQQKIREPLFLWKERSGRAGGKVSWKRLAGWARCGSLFSSHAAVTQSCQLNHRSEMKRARCFREKGGENGWSSPVAAAG